MQFKVGDRVEVVEPAEGLIDGQANNLGAGTVLDFDAYQVRVKVDANDGAWWYDLQNVRPLIPAGAITIKKEDPPTTVADLTTPSITVGTQVRLTGVVRDCNDSVAAVAIGGMAGDNNTIAWVMLDQIEVIRQPFKRGEVVWSCGAVATGEQYVVFNDENNGRVDVVHCDTGTATKGNDASRFERRP